MFGTCSSYTGVTSTNGPAICNNITDNSGTPKHCTYLTGLTCSDTTTCALSFTGLDSTTGPKACRNVINNIKQRCKYIGGGTCVDGLCTDKTDA